MPRLRLAVLPPILCVVLPLVDLAWNLTHLNIGLSDFYGLALASRALALHGAWPQTPYFPVLYPVLLAPFGLAGSVLAGGYVLSAGGLMLALFALKRLVVVLSRGAAVQRPPSGQTEGERALHSSAPTGPPVALVLAAILLAWLLPVWRVVAGSPSVDALYTGLGLWFLTAAVAAWKSMSSSRGAAVQRPPPSRTSMQAKLPSGAPVVDSKQILRSANVEADEKRADAAQQPPYGKGPSAARPLLRPLPLVLVLWISAFLLPLLRYHAVVLVIPIALLLFLRVRGRWAAAAVLKSGVAALAFNLLGFAFAYGHLPASVAQLQIRTGIEIEQHLHYASAQELWDNYPDLCQRARSFQLLEDYTPGQLATHVGRNLLMFLRQPAIALALLLTFGVGLFCSARAKSGRAALQPGDALLALWLVLYCLALSLAYYTARAALLPDLAALGLALALAVRLGPRWLLVSAVLVLAGNGLASRFALQDFHEREFYASANRELDAQRATVAAPAAGTLAGDARLVALKDNPWCLPYATAHGSWLDDPEIPAQLTAGWQRLDPRQALDYGGSLQLVALDTLHPDPALTAELQHGGVWGAAPATPALQLYRRR